MSPTCCILLPGPGQVPGLQFINNSVVNATSSLVFSALAAKQHQQQTAQPDPFEPLKQLGRISRVERGTAEQLQTYQNIVREQIEQALAYLDGDAGVLGLSEQLRKALRLVSEGKTTQAHSVAVEMLGYAGLAGQAVMSVGVTTTSSSSSVSSQFKVPAPPSKKRTLDQSETSSRLEQSHHRAGQPQSPSQPPQLLQQQQPAQQQQLRKHSAPKRRATPQVLPGAPFSITPNAPPASESHGETVCDEQLLSCWCPISGKRQRIADNLQDNRSSCSNNAAASSAASTGSTSWQEPVSPAALNQHGQLSSAANSITGSGSSGCSLQQPKAPLPPSSGRSAAAAARAAAHAEAAEALVRLLHEDSRHSKPAADVLLFNKTAQQPINSWTGTINHKFGGRVVELCSATLQVPAPFSEEFPRALYAADVRHRRSVSLGRHVVCRATLGALTEHQLMALSAMAKGQLVALCSLQTAELHLVPYFDNKNLVRMVGFLKIRSE